jgi:hypothetical protein
MLKYPAEPPHGVQRGLEAALVLAVVVASALAHERPPGARRVRHDCPRAAVEARVPRFVPRVYVRKVEVNAVSLDVERSNRHHLNRQALLCQHSAKPARSPGAPLAPGVAVTSVDEEGAVKLLARCGLIRSYTSSGTRPGSE